MSSQHGRLPAPPSRAAAVGASVGRPEEAPTGSSALSTCCRRARCVAEEAHLRRVTSSHRRTQRRGCRTRRWKRRLTSRRCHAHRRGCRTHRWRPRVTARCCSIQRRGCCTHRWRRRVPGGCCCRVRGRRRVTIWGCCMHRGRRRVPSRCCGTHRSGMLRAPQDASRPPQRLPHALPKTSHHRHVLPHAPQGMLHAPPGMPHHQRCVQHASLAATPPHPRLRSEKRTWHVHNLDLALRHPSPTP